MTPEGKVKKEVDVQLALYLAYKHKPVQNGMGEPALDYHGCHKGFYLGIETKAPRGAPTIRQLRTMNKIKAAGGALFLVPGRDSPDMAQLIGWLINPTPGFISQSAREALAGAIINTMEDPHESRDDRFGDAKP